MLKQSAAPAAIASSLHPPSQCADIARIGTRHVSDCAPAGLYGRLEKESKAGRPLSEIVEDIFERRPDQQARSAVCRYLMDKVNPSKNGQG